MRRSLTTTVSTLALVIASAGCNNFQQLVDRCVSEGRCGDSGFEGDGGGSEGSGGGGAESSGGGGQAVGGGSSASTGGGSSTPSATLVPPSPDSVDFGPVPLFDTSQTANLTVLNQGPGDVTVVGSIVGDAQFSVTGGGGLVVANTSVTFHVTFNPVGTSGPQSASLQVTASGANTLNLVLTGTTVPTLDLSPLTLDFSTVNVGANTTLPLRISNPTGSSRAITLIINPNPGSAFSDPGNECSTIVSGQTCTAQLQFRPPDAGDWVGELNLSTVIGSHTYTAPNVDLSGTGIPQGALSLTLATPLVGFGIDAGQTFDDVFTLSNSALNPIGPISVSLNPNTTGAFTLVDAGCPTLAAGASCQGVVRLHSDVIGQPTASLVANAGLGGIATVPLSATVAGNFALHVSVNGGTNVGVVTADGGSLDTACADDCTTQYRVVPPGYPLVVLQAQRLPYPNQYGLSSWSGDCTGMASCALTMNAAHSAAAHYALPNVAFATSKLVTGVGFGGVPGADALCAASAADAGLPGTFVAWLSTTGSSAPSRLPALGGWVRPDRLPFTVGKTSLLTNQVLYPLALDEHGVAGALTPWTGTQRDGTTSSANCGDWLDAGTDGGATGAVGSQVAGAGGWTAFGINPTHSVCTNTSLPIFCFETDSVVSAQAPPPPPVGGVRLFLSRTLGAVAADAGLPGLDAICHADSNSGYSAFVSTTTASATARLDGGMVGPLYRPDGVMLLPDVSVMRTMTPTLLAAPDVMYSGAFVAADGSKVLTGSSTTTNPSSMASYSCQDWRGSGGLGIAGDFEGTSVPTWLQIVYGNISGFCPPNGGSRVYCIGKN